MCGGKLVDMILDLCLACRVVSLHIARDVSHLNLRPLHNIKDLVGLLGVNRLETTIDRGKLLHDFHVLAS